MIPRKITDDMIREVLAPVRKNNMGKAVGQIRDFLDYVNFSPWSIWNGEISMTYVRENICPSRIPHPITGQRNGMGLIDYFIDKTDAVFIIEKGYSIPGGPSELTRIVVNPAVRTESFESMLKRYDDDLERARKELAESGLQFREVEIAIDPEILRKGIEDGSRKAFSLHDDYRKAIMKGGKGNDELEALAPIDREIRQIQLLRTVCERDGGKLKWIEYEHPLGRDVARGRLTFQTMARILREKILKGKIEVDINSCAPVAIFHEAAQSGVWDAECDAARGITADTKAFRIRAAKIVFQTDSPAEEEIAAIKEGVTMMFFGARMDESPYARALINVFADKALKERFLRLPEIIAAKRVIRRLKNSFTDEELAAVHALVGKGKKKGNAKRKNRRKTMLAYLHQDAERSLRQSMMDVAEREGFKILLQIHDAIILDMPGYFDAAGLERALSDEFRRFGMSDLSASVKIIGE